MNLPANRGCRYLTVSVSGMGWSWSGIPDNDVAGVVSVIVEVPDGVTTDGGVEGDGVTVELAVPQPAA